MSAGSLVPATAGPVPVVRIDVMSPMRLAETYGVALQPPAGGEELFVGVARNSDKRTEEEDYWPLFSSTPRRRQNQIFTFVVEVPDETGNPIEHVPVEVRGQEISGVLPGDSTPVAVYGTRNARDGVIRTYKVLNLRTRSSLTVTIKERDRCFIATSVYGSVYAPQVISLRQWRNRRLLPHAWGRIVVQLYYWTSPPLAVLLSRYPALRIPARRVLDLLVAQLGECSLDPDWQRSHGLRAEDLD